MKLLSIGSIQKPFGIKGEVKVFLKTDFVKERFKPGTEVTLELNGKSQKLEIESIRKHQGSLLVKFVGLDSLNDVEFFHKGDILVPEVTRHELPKDEFYFDELVNLEVFSENEKIGFVSEMIDNPAHPIMRVKTPEKDILVPFRKVFVLKVDMEAKRIDVFLMEGLA